MRLVPKSITEIVQIKTSIEELGWFEFRAKLHENMENVSVDVYSSPEEKTVFFKNTTEIYKLITVNEDLLLVAVTDDGYYEICFKRVGDEVRFEFEGSQECFMCESMERVFQGIVWWSNQVIRTKLELIQY